MTFIAYIPPALALLAICAFAISLMINSNND